MPGQGNPNPPGGFFNHFIVKYDGKYYDPSYGGGPFDTQNDWENASLDGFFIDTGLVVGGKRVQYAKKNDPTVVETVFF